MLRAIHLKTAGLTTEWATAMAEMTVSRVAGVARVVAVKSMGLVSVMFDDSLTKPERILAALTTVGFDAKMLSPGS
jgi:hypothetical protein